MTDDNTPMPQDPTGATVNAADVAGPNDAAEPAAAGAPAAEPAPAESPAAAAGEADPVAQAQAEVARLRDQLLRTAADFDNFRKRTRRELSDAERRAREDVLRDLLPVFDNLERASAHASGATDMKALVDGLEMVMRQFSDTLTKLGVERVPSVGTAFDPALHEALQQMETSEFEPGCVATEIQAGYKMGDHLVRPALVIVAKRPSSAS